MQNEVRQSILTLENQSKLTLTGVERVDAFSEHSISLTVNGQKVRIDGSKLKVLAFSEGSGSFAASGQVNAVKYSSQQGSSVKRLFK